MKNKILLPSAEWAILSATTVLDPDGWNRKDFQASWNEPITFEEFRIRAIGSTTNMDRRTEEQIEFDTFANLR